MSDSVLETIFMNEKVQKMTAIEQSDFIDLFENILEKIREVKPDATVSELLP